VIVTETRLAMTRFPTAADLVSWTKLSSRTVQSRVPRPSGHTGNGNPYMKCLFGEAGEAAAAATIK
jgi:transposase